MKLYSLDETRRYEMIDMMLQQESNNIVTMPLAGHRSGG